MISFKYKTIVTFLLAITLITALTVYIRNVMITDEFIVRVTDLEKQITTHDGHTTVRYLIVTEDETFINVNSLYFNKYDNDALFHGLQLDSLYHFKVQGIGKGLFCNYRNLLSYSKVSETSR